MGKLTTHILDTAHGGPAGGLSIRLYRCGVERELLVETLSNADGRSSSPLVEGDAFASGCYELEFDAGAYFAATDSALAEPPFLDTVVIRFNARGDENYHVPLLVSPWSYSTYRGS